MIVFVKTYRMMNRFLSYYHYLTYYIYMCTCIKTKGMPKNY